MGRAAGSSLHPAVVALVLPLAGCGFGDVPADGSGEALTPGGDAVTPPAGGGPDLGLPDDIPTQDEADAKASRIIDQENADEAFLKLRKQIYQDE